MVTILCLNFVGEGMRDALDPTGDADALTAAAAGYMASLPSRKAPFVFSCFNGTSGDVQVLTHELGHAFAGYLTMRSQPIKDFFAKSTDISEIHSMSMEQFAYPYAGWFFGDQADKFRFSYLQEAITFVPFGVAVDEFQHICYSCPELTPRERTLEWRKLERKYMPWRQYEDGEFMERGAIGITSCISFSTPSTTSTIP